jgi:hypothetical protein
VNIKRLDSTGLVTVFDRTIDADTFSSKSTSEIDGRHLFAKDRYKLFWEWPQRDQQAR